MAVINRYAQALCQVSVRQGVLPEIASFLGVLLKAFEETTKLSFFLSHPNLTFDEKCALVGEDLFPQEMTPEARDIMKNFFFQIIAYKRFFLLKKIYKAFMERHDDHLGIRRLSIITPHALTSPQKDLLLKGLEKRFPGRLILDVQRESNLLGGIIVRCRDVVLDASLKTTLAQWKMFMKGQ